MLSSSISAFDTTVALDNTVLSSADNERLLVSPLLDDVEEGEKSTVKLFILILRSRSILSLCAIISTTSSTTHNPVLAANEYTVRIKNTWVK